MFDADAYLEALEPPQITIGGKTYKGRFLSLEEWLPFEPRLQAVAEQKASPQEIQTVVKDFCDQAFPPKFFDLFNLRKKTVGELVIALPPAALIKAAVSFFECQARGVSGRNEENNESTIQEE